MVLLTLCTVVWSHMWVQLPCLLRKNEWAPSSLLVVAEFIGWDHILASLLTQWAFATALYLAVSCYSQVNTWAHRRVPVDAMLSKSQSTAPSVPSPSRGTSPHCHHLQHCWLSLALCCAWLWVWPSLAYTDWCWRVEWHWTPPASLRVNLILLHGAEPVAEADTRQGV